MKPSLYYFRGTESWHLIYLDRWYHEMHLEFSRWEAGISYLCNLYYIGIIRRKL